VPKVEKISYRLQACRSRSLRTTFTPLAVPFGGRFGIFSNESFAVVFAFSYAYLVNKRKMPKLSAWCVFFWGRELDEHEF
jgi:hypothetical protein